LKVVKSNGGRAVAHLRAINAPGDLRVGAAFVHDGAIEWSTVPLVLAAPGRPRDAVIAPQSSEFAPGESAKLRFDGGAPAGTLVVRISRGAPSGSALFASAPSLLEIGVSTTQNSAAGTATWHPWVNSTGERAQVLGFVRHTEPPPELALAQAETEAVSWSVARTGDNGFAVVLPERSGRYNLSVLDIADDGSVSAGSSTVVVR
jgi:hypothetical protein